MELNNDLAEYNSNISKIKCKMGERSESRQSIDTQEIRTFIQYCDFQILSTGDESHSPA